LQKSGVGRALAKACGFRPPPSSFFVAINFPVNAALCCAIGGGRG